jgi:hypothetical protein
VPQSKTAVASPLRGQAAPSSPDWYNARDFLHNLRRVNLFCGGFGSGKTEVAVNFAVRMRAAGQAVSIADLDIVNPYFRSREVRGPLRDMGIEVLLPSEALVDADLPIIQPEIQGALDQSRGVLVLDLGGDPVGARVLASLAPHVRPREFSGCFVLNSRRPFTATVAGAVKMMRDISAAGVVQLGGVVVNSHLIEETTAEVILEGIALAEAVSAETGAQVAFVAVERRMIGEFDAASCRYPVMVMDRFMLKPWERSHCPAGAVTANWLGKYRIQAKSEV